MNNLHLERLFYDHYINLAMLLCVRLMDGAAIEAT